MANYAEARGAESRRGFVHKVQICLKERREVSVWLLLATRLGPRNLDNPDLEHERGELIAIFVATFNTAKASRRST